MKYAVKIYTWLLRWFAGWRCHWNRSSSSRWETWHFRYKKNEVSQNSNKSHLTPGLYRRELACKGVLRPYQGLLDQAARQGFGKPPGSLNQKEMLKI